MGFIKDYLDRINRKILVFLEQDFIKSLRLRTKNSFSFSKKILSRHPFLVAGVFLLLISGSLFIRDKFTDHSFYSFLKNDNSLSLRRAITLFSEHNYLGVTSYIDNEVLNMKDSKEKSTLLFLQAESYFLMDGYLVAQKKFQALSHSKFPLWQVRLRLASLAIVFKKYDQAKNLLKRVPSGSSEYYYWEGRYYQETGDLEKAKKYFYKMDKSSDDSQYRLGQIYFIQKDYKNASVFFKSLEDKDFKDKVSVLEYLFEIANYHHDTAEMNRYLKKLKPAILKNTSLLKKIFQIYYHLGDLKTAESLLYSFIRENDILTSDLSSMLTRLNFKLGNYSKVIHYSKFFDLNKQDKLHLLESLFKSNYYYQTLKLIQKYLKDRSFTNAEKMSILEYYCGTYTNHNQIKPAIKIAQKIVGLDPSLEHLKQLAELYSKTGATYHTAYIKTLFRIYHKQPSLLHSLLENLSLRNKNLLLQKVLAENSTQEDALFYKAQTLLAQGKFSEVEVLLYHVIALPLKNYDIRFQALYALGTLLLSEKKYKDALYFLEEANNLKDNVHLKIRLALSYYYMKNMIASLKIVQNIEGDAFLKNSLTSDEKQILSTLFQHFHQI